MQTYEIIAKASDPSNGARTFLWPVLEAGNDSFPQGIYTVSCSNREIGTSCNLTHQIVGAPLISRWLKQKQLYAICTVAAPRSMYRELHQSQTPRQSIDWSEDDLGEQPIFTPMLVAGDEIRHTVKADQDGLNPVWDGRKLHIPKAGRIAIGPTFQFKSGFSGIMDFVQDAELAAGQFKVEPSNEDGFKFRVHLHPELHRYLSASINRNHPAGGNNIMVHIVAAALGILQREYAKDDDANDDSWKSYRNLLGIAGLLEQEKLPHWTDAEFDPSFAATAIYPHRIP